MKEKLLRFWAWLINPIYPSAPLYPLWFILDMALFIFGFVMLLSSLGVFFK